MLNIAEESLLNKQVEIAKTNQLFCIPNKSDMKEFRKILMQEFERDYNIRQLIVALFINTPDGTAPYYTIGLKVEKDFNNYLEPIRKALYTEFREHTYFEFVDLNETEKHIGFLLRQGESIIDR